MVISSPTIPGSPLTPKSLRLIFVVAEAPVRRRSLPIGSLIDDEGPSTSRTTSLVTPLIVRSPVTFSLPVPAASTFLDWKVMVAYFWASRKRGLRRSLSRISTRVSTEAASMVVWIEDLFRLAGSYTTLPLTLVKAPRTVETPRWRTENCAEECCGSSCQVSCAAADRVRSRAAARAESVRDIISDSPGFVRWLQFSAFLGARRQGWPVRINEICRLKDPEKWLCSHPRGVAAREEFQADSSYRRGCSWRSGRRHLCAAATARTARLRRIEYRSGQHLAGERGSCSRARAGRRR